LNNEPTPEIYVSFLQQPAVYPAYGAQPRLGRQLMIRTTADQATMAESVEKIVRDLDSAQMVFDSKSMRQRIRDWYSGETFLSTFLGVFSGLALLLAAIGIYGVMSYAVTQRRSEIGIRMVLGAERGNVLRMILAHGLGLTIAGLLLAAGGSYVVVKTIASAL